MWQGYLRNWLMGQARERLRTAAAEAAHAQTQQANPKSAAEQGPPEPKHDVCHVGVVFALGIEAGGLLDRLKGVVATHGAGFVAREGGLEGKRIVVVESGVGKEPAARAAEALILGHRPRWLISAGYAGALDKRLERGDILLANQIVDAAGRSFEIDFKLAPEVVASTKHLHVGRLLTVDHVIEDPREKQALGATHAALAADMETIAVAEVCRNEKTRFLAVRVVSDTADQSLPRDIDYLVRRRTAASRLGAAAGAILRRPGSIKDMWQLKEDALVASDRLAAFLGGIIGQLP
jgi:adenosylhomocysteine nucleosidase